MSETAGRWGSAFGAALRGAGLRAVLVSAVLVNAVLASALLGACGAKAKDSELAGSETHFLSACNETCNGEFECIDGVCTRRCEEATDCSSLHAAASCVATSSDSAPVMACQVECLDHAECAEQDPKWVCRAGRCERPDSPGDDGRSGGTTPDCPDFPGGITEPVDIETSAMLIPDSAEVRAAAADEQGVYWIDSVRALWTFSKSSQTTTQLAAPPDDTPGGADPRAIQVTGLLTTQDTVYWAEAVGPDPDLPSADPPGPPARLWAVSKATGDSTLLLDTDELLLRLLGVADGEIVSSTGVRAFALDPAGELEPRPLSHVPDTYTNFELVDGNLYWASSMTESFTLMTAPVVGGDAAIVATSSEEVSSGFLVNRDVALLAPEMLEQEPLNLVQHFVMYSLDGNCTTELPSLGTSIGSQIIDDTHVYWKSFNGLGGVTQGDDLNAGVPYVRVNLESGSLERLDIEGFAVSLVTDIMAQDANAIYFRQNADGSLMAVSKP